MEQSPGYRHRFSERPRSAGVGDGAQSTVCEEAFLPLRSRPQTRPGGDPGGLTPLGGWAPPHRAAPRSPSLAFGNMAPSSTRPASLHQLVKRYFQHNLI